jgi:hypothetical protein
MKALLSKPYFLVLLVLTGISINGALVIGGLSLLGRVLAPKAPAEVAEVKPQLLPIPSSSQEVPLQSTAPEPIKVRLQDGLDLGYKAAIMAGTAKSSEEWVKVSLKWTEAVRKLKEIPGSSPEYSAARAKITEYLMNAETASANGVMQDIAEYTKSLDTSTALPEAPANQPVAQAPAPTQPQQVTYLEPSNGDVNGYSNPEEDLEYLSMLNDLESLRASRVRLSQMGDLINEDFEVMVNSANYYGGTNGSDICDYPWQTDSLGRRCGNRAASERPGGY